MSTPKDTQPGRTGWIYTAALATALWIIAIGCAVADAVSGGRVPDTAVNAVLGLALAATIIAVSLRAGVDHSQIQTGIGRLTTDTGEISRHAIQARLAMVDAPEIIVVKERERSYEQVDRSALQRMLTEATKQQTAGTDRTDYWDIYTDVLTDLAGIGQDADPPADPAQ